MQSKRFLLFLYSFLFFSIGAKAQLGVAFHQSNFFKFGLFYEIEDFVIAETRLVSDLIVEDLSIEFLGHIKAIRRDDYEFYAGAGWGQSALPDFIGPILTAGVNIYPLKKKNLGLHFEFNPIFPEDLDSPVIIRGSWGLRYCFAEWEE